MIERTILMPEDRPDHDTIGRPFKGHDGVFYYCDSYDPAIGFWMTPLFPGQIGMFDALAERKNVSERAIGRTFMRVHVYHDEDGASVHCRYTVPDELRATMRDPARFEALIAAARASVPAEFGAWSECVDNRQLAGL